MEEISPARLPLFASNALFTLVLCSHVSVFRLLLPSLPKTCATIQTFSMYLRSWASSKAYRVFKLQSRKTPRHGNLYARPSPPRQKGHVKELALHSPDLTATSRPSSTSYCLMYLPPLFSCSFVFCFVSDVLSFYGFDGCALSALCE